MKILNKSITKTVFLLSVCLAVVLPGRTIQAQVMLSDYEIQQKFREDLKTINESLEEVDSLDSVNRIIDRIRLVEGRYGSKEELLDKALYPDTFDQRMEELKKRAVTVQQRLATIKHHESRVQELTVQLSAYNDMLGKMDNRTDSLRKMIRESVRSEQQLSGQVRKYRQSLEQRDQLILSIIDSLMIAYDDLEVTDPDDMENTTRSARMSAEGNPIKLIRSIVTEKARLAQSNTALTAGDYLRMRTVENRFSRMWRRVGDKLAEVYSENPEEVKSEISGALDSWEKQIDERLWTSIHRSFEEAGVRLDEFQNSESFYETLNGYLEQGISQSQNNGTTKEIRTQYANFSEFWNNRVKSGWGSFLYRGEIFTFEQMLTIDEKVDRWTALAQPETDPTNIYAYLFGVSLLAIVVLGAVLFREKINHFGQDEKNASGSNDEKGDEKKEKKA